MVDQAIVLVDAAEGPMPQTKFVVGKALKVGLKPIVVINKIDRPDARHVEVVNEVFDLFAALDATDEQLDFPILYGSAKEGWIAAAPDGPKDAGMAPLFDLVLEHVAPPRVEEGPFRLLGTILEANPYLGRIVTGNVSLKAISGPISIAETTGFAVRQGWRTYLSTLALISISLGVLNLLPIPILDGGQIVYQLAELVKGRPVSDRAQLLGQQGAEVDEVEAESLGSHQRSRLLDVRTQPLAPRRVQQVRRRVIAPGGVSDGGRHVRRWDRHDGARDRHVRDRRQRPGGVR
jgi:hypothetical protein